jgi:alpha-tubulin suppressor-like RCC1 family protein
MATNRIITSVVVTLFLLSAAAVRADLSAAFNSRTDVPETAANYAATGTISITLGFAPTPGTNLTVIKNTGLPFIDGQFSNLANGATVNLSYNGTTYPFVAWYYGGQGNNDLVLLWPYTGVAAWGYNRSGQLGDNTTKDRSVPTEVDQSGILQGKTIVQVASGSFHCLALCSDGTVAAWGSNNYGQLGDSSSINRLAPVMVNMTAGTSALAGKRVIAIAAGGYHSLALCSDGTVAAWGYSSYGQLGDGGLPPQSTIVPIAVSAVSGISALFTKTVVAISAGGLHSLAMCDDGTVVAWGDNRYGQLGDNSTTSRRVPVAVNTEEGTSALFGKTVVTIGAGHSHSLTVCGDGSVATWGNNYSGQLGDNSLRSRQVPVAVNAASELSALNGKSVVAVTAGTSHNLALCSDGTLAAWGYNASGALGDNSTTNRQVPVVVNTESALSGKTVIKITAMSEHSLALCSDGTMAAWGDNDYGQLGDNSTINRITPATVSKASVLLSNQVNLTSISAGGDFNLAFYGAAQPEIEVEVLEPNVTALNDQTSIVDFGSVIAASRTFRVRNMGGLPLNNLSASIIGTDAASFILTNQPKSAIAGSDPTSFQVAFTSASQGAKSAFLEITSNDSNETPFRIALTGTRSATMSANFTTATDIPLTSSAINPTGSTLSFTLGFKPTPGTNLTVIKNTGLPFIDGQFSNLANGATVNLSYNGTTYPFVAWYYGGQGNNDLVLLWPSTGLAAWGNNSNGQLGDNSLTHRSTPVAVQQSGVLAGKTIVQVARGDGHSLALCSDGTVAAWGNNNYGQLGNNNTTTRQVPVTVNVTPGLSALAGKTVIAIAAGDARSIALCSDGSLAAWGYNSHGQLGNNSQTSRSVPVAVNAAPGLSALAGKSVAAIAMGGDHSLALCSDGTLVAWGKNVQGQLGNDSVLYSQVPVTVSTLAGASALAGRTVITIAAGGNHSLALCSDGTVASWGEDYFGNQGLPRAVNMKAGESALAGKTVIGLAGGDEHSLALCSDGTVAAWGSNNTGQLGINSFTRPTTPVAVNTVSGTSALAGKSVVAIGTGNLHSLALTLDGMAASWGWNPFGQLGDNTTFERLAPVAVNIAAETSVLAGKNVSGLSVGARANHSIVIYGQAPPEIVITGNNIDISHSDTTPNAADFTDFGCLALLNEQVSHAFTLKNMGTFPLNLTGTPLIRLTGAGAEAFSATLLPSSDTVSSNGNTSFVITFDPLVTGTHTATVTIQSNAINHPNFSFNIRGFGALSTTRTQTITFAPPTTVDLGKSPLNLSAFASSGLPVTLSVVPSGTTAAGASIVGGALSFTGTGTVRVQATQTGNGIYSAAPTVIRTITIKPSPSVLTLFDLAQTYTGTPREISTLGGSGTVSVEYKIGTTFGNTAPTNAGSYSVRATDSRGPKTGTLVISKAPLYVTPTDQRKFVGQDNPPLTLTYSGWVNGETASLVTTAPLLRATVQKTSIGGLYPITASGGAPLANYAYIYQQGTMVVDSFAGNYETLLAGEGSGLLGKLEINIVAAGTSFSGKLYCTDEKTALSLKGTLLTYPTTESATGSASVRSGGIAYMVNISTQINGRLSGSVTRAGNAYAQGTGRRLLLLAARKTVSYGGAHTVVLEPASPTTSTVPAGAGWATAAISTSGIMTLSGRLGDGTVFTSSLKPDNAADPVFRLFVQPYRTGTATRTLSHIGGALTLLPHPLAGRRCVAAAALSWMKAGQTADTIYPEGFGPVSSVLMLDPWLPPVTARGTLPAITLADRLGLTGNAFQILHSPTSSNMNGNLPTGAGLTATNLVTVVANTTKWKTTLVPTTGTFSGSFELADTTPKPRVATFTGVLRQPATAPDKLIGDGHYLLPPLTGTSTSAGEIIFQRP